MLGTWRKLPLLVALVAMLASMVTFTGLATSASAATTTGHSVSAPAALATYTSRENRFYRNMIADDPTWAAVPKKQLVKAGKLVCKMVKNGYSVQEVGGILMDSDLTANDAASLVVNAIWDLCPSEKWQLP